MKQCRSGTTAALLLAGAAMSLTPTFAQTAAPTTPSVKSPRWENYRKDIGHTGFVESQVPMPISLVWRFTGASTNDNPASVAYANGMVYFAGGSHITAVNAADGTQKWQATARNTKTGVFTATPVISGNALYVGDYTGYFYKFDLNTGEKLWQAKFGGSIRSAAVLDGGMAYFGCDDGSINAVSADTGETIWTLPTGGSISTSPTLVDGLLIFASSDNSVYGLDATSGRQRWSQRFTGDPTIAPPVVNQGDLYVGAGSYIYSLIVRTGTTKWRARLSADIVGPITVGMGGLYVLTQDEQVQGLSERGRSQWSTPLNDRSEAPPLLTKNLLFVATNHGTVNAYDVNTGAMKWQYEVQTSVPDATQQRPTSLNVAAAPVFVDDTLFVVGDDGTLSAFRGTGIDAIPPIATKLQPAPGARAASYDTPFQVQLVDDGSGINPSTVKLTVDGKPVPAAHYDPTQNSVVATTTGLKSTVKPLRLSDGRHQVTLTATDWRGNTLTQNWGFVADSTLNDTSNGEPADTDDDPTPNNRGPQNGRNGTPRRNPGGGFPGGGGGTPPPPPPL